MKAQDETLLRHLHSVREYELSLIVASLHKLGFVGCKVLEVGAGTGFQALALSGHGYDVNAIDLQSSNYAASRIYHIQEYDGKHIPFADKTFDVVLSSSVIEHVQDIDNFQYELHRVLKTNGVAIHIVPNAIWRLATSFSFYPYIIKNLFSKLLLNDERRIPGGQSANAPMIKSRSTWMKWIPARHGELGNVLTETWHFREHRWRNHFENTGWVILSSQDCGLFYTGYTLLGGALSLPARKTIAGIIGGVTSIFILKHGDLNPK